MSTIVYLARHATPKLPNSILVGRGGGALLGVEGQRQAALLADRFAGEHISAVETSPRAAPYETAAIIAARNGFSIEAVDALDEVDFGEWTGRSTKELGHDLRWHRWNAARGQARCPGGESMVEVQDRILRHILHTNHDRRGGRILMVTHAEVIRAVLLHCLGFSLDEFRRIEILPSSVSTLVVDDRGSDLTVVNGRIAA